MIVFSFIIRMLIECGQTSEPIGSRENNNAK